MLTVDRAVLFQIYAFSKKEKNKNKKSVEKVESVDLLLVLTYYAFLLTYACSSLKVLLHRTHESTRTNKIKNSSVSVMHLIDKGYLIVIL